MAESIKQTEQKHLNYVIEKIQQAEEKQRQSITHAKKDEKDIQKDYYNDVRLRSNTWSGLMTTSVEIRQKQQMITERRKAWQQATKVLNRLKELEKNPYFARIDFTSDDDNKEHTIYIGLTSLVDVDDPTHYLVYDWRAPISSIYYENKTGAVSYETPSGKKSVNINLKRQFQINDGKIETVFDTDANIGDQLLLNNLGGHSSSKMKNIVTTIQKEQDRVIRDTDSDLLFVQGAAGSGKTSAALQRVAFLLYHYRESLNYKQIILFSPNQLFNDYVNRVLPSLGEHNMVQMTYYQYSDHRVPQLNVETLAQRFVEDNSDSNQSRINDVKNSINFFNAMTEYTKDLGQNGMQFKNITLNKQIFVSKEDIRRIYYSFNQNYNLGNRLSATRDELFNILDQRVNEEMHKKWVEDAVENLNREQLETIQQAHPNEFQNMDHAYEFLAKHIVLGAFRQVRRQIQRNLFLNMNLQFIHLLKEIPNYLDLSDYGLDEDQWRSNIQKTIDSMEYQTISMSDVSAYLYLFDRIVGSHGHRDIQYIFVDEAQDYTPFQMAFLKYSFPRAKFTVLGDLNQAIFTHEESSSLLSELKPMFNQVNEVTLNKSYRSTRQISDFSNHVLPKEANIESFARDGKLPQINISANRSEEISRLVNIINDNQDRYESIAIIGKDLSTCRVLYQQLQKEKVQSTLIRTENQRLVSGILIIPAYLAKGLEFDAVVMWDASPDNYSSDWQLVYTICTRAMHRLDIMTIGELSPLLETVPKDLYQAKSE